ISVHDVRDEARLRDKYDVILFGPSSGDARVIVRGVTGPRPLPWKKTDITPNLGTPDETDDMRGGLELSGVLNLQNFVKQGGTLVTLTSSSSLPVHYDFAPTVNIRQPTSLWARGGVFRTQLVDRGSPLAYGYDDELGVYFNTGPLFTVGGGGGFGGGGGGVGGGGQAAQARAASDGSTTARRSGRGGIDEPDIVQGRPRDLGQAGVEEFRQQQRDSAAATTPSTSTVPGVRTIFRFSNSVQNLLISGGLRNGNELAGAPALLHAPLERGNVVMFSFNPFWRSHTHGTYATVFNVLLHHNSLDIGRPAPGRPAATNPQDEHHQP
ncbi:MAG TPA: hypothetical protein VK928_05920, partial [Longimicrobiales bacterium]|nr:hypothetical protein [Longimicrobiales bacterium]